MGHEVGAFARATGRTVGGEEAGADKPRYRRYQYDLIAPHCGCSVLEVGAGLGEFAAQFTGRERLVVSDVDPDAVALLNPASASRAVGPLSSAVSTSAGEAAAGARRTTPTRRSCRSR